MTQWPHVFRAAFVLHLVASGPLMSQEEFHREAGGGGSHELRLKSRTIRTDLVPGLGAGVQLKTEAAKRAANGRVHLIAQTDGNPLDIGLLAEHGVTVLGYIPDNGVAISARAGEDLSGLGFGWVGALEAADRQGFVDMAAPETDDAPGYYVVQFYSDVDMGDARSAVLDEQIQIQDNPSLLTTQLLVLGTNAQMVELSALDVVVYIFPASDELIQGMGVTPCISGLTSYGQVLPFAASLTAGGWSEDSTGTARMTYSFGPMTTAIPDDTLRQLFLQAQAQWSSVAQIAFSETTNRTGPRNVDFGFYSGDHGDGFPFDVSGAVLAHTFFPSPPNSEPIAGDMHLNMDESWTTNGSGRDFYSVVLHEMGHALGLVHTTNPTDVMYPFYRGNTTFSQTDINQIQSMYTVPTVVTTPASQPLALTVQTPGSAQVTDGTIPLSGTTSGGQGTIVVTWTTDRGGLGTAQGSANWSVAAVPLGVGSNTITVKAQDGASSVVTKAVVVVRTNTTPPPPPPPPPPTTPQAPTIQITSPSDGTQTTATSADVKGTATHPVGIKSISWWASTGASGLAMGTTFWDTGFVGLAVGINTVTIDAVALDGGAATKTIQITVTTPAPPPGGGGGGTDTTPPSMTILSPSTTSVFTSNSSITISGTASDNVGVTAVRWQTPISGGVATGTTNWSTGPIPLYVGMNNVVVQAYDGAGNMAWRSVSVTRQ